MTERSSKINSDGQKDDRYGHVPAVFIAGSIWSMLNLHLWYCNSRTRPLWATNGVQWQVLKAATSSSSKWCHSLWRLWDGLCFHRLSWTVAASVHVPLTIFWVWICILRTSPLLPICSPTPSRLRIQFLPIKWAPTHCKKLQRHQNDKNVMIFYSKLKRKGTLLNQSTTKKAVDCSKTSHKQEVEAVEYLTDNNSKTYNTP